MTATGLIITTNLEGGSINVEFERIERAFFRWADCIGFGPNDVGHGTAVTFCTEPDHTGKLRATRVRIHRANR